MIFGLVKRNWNSTPLICRLKCGWYLDSENCFIKVYQKDVESRRNPEVCLTGWWSWNTRTTNTRVADMDNTIVQTPGPQIIPGHVEKIKILLWPYKLRTYSPSYHESSKKQFVPKSGVVTTSFLDYLNRFSFHCKIQ